MTRIRAALCVAVCVLTAAACGSSTSASPAQPARVDLRGRTHVDVDAMSNRFDPAEIVINPGTTVTWHNRDAITHNIAPAPGAVDFGGAFGADSGAFGPRATYAFTFKKAGDFAYECTIHPGMIGDVRVAT